VVTGDGVPAERVAGMIIGDSRLAGELRRVVQERGWQDGPLFARRAVEERWADGCACPSGSDYLLAARLVADAGYELDADLLRLMAGIERILARHESRWQHRYDGYVHLGADELAALFRDGVRSLGTPCRGIDGARYIIGRFSATSPGYETTGVLAATRAGCELLAGWDSPAAADDWVRGRLAPATGPLMPPGGHMPRLAREEQVLAFVLRYPWELDAVAAALPGYVFTADLRDEIFAAARMLHASGGTVDAATVAAETERRCAWAPSWAREILGGPRAPLAAGYVRRLAVTPVTSAAAQQAISELVRPRQIPSPAHRPACAARSSLPVTAMPPEVPPQSRRAPAPRR